MKKKTALLLAAITILGSVSLGAASVVEAKNNHDDHGEGRGRLTALMNGLGNKFGLKARADAEAKLKGEAKLEDLKDLKLRNDLKAQLALRADAGSRPEIHIGANGNVLVRGAKVTAVSDETITAKVAWGSYATTWTLDVSDAKVIQRNGGASSLDNIEVGNTVSFNGTLNTGSSGATVKVNVLKNWSLGDARFGSVLQGEVRAMSDDEVPATLTVRVEGKDYSVEVDSETKILAESWNRIDLDEFEVGDDVRFYGSVDGTSVEAALIQNLDR